MADELLDRARAGDHDAFSALVEPYRRELHVHCYRMLGSFEDAEDCLQDALLAAWVGLAGFEGRSSVRTWLHRVVTHRCLNQLRAAGRRPVPAAPTPQAPPTGRAEVVWLQPYPDLLLDGLPDPAPGPEARYESREAVSLAFVTAVQLLPPRQRAVVLLRDVLGYRAAEVADLLDVTEDAVTSALRRARTTLAAQRRSDPPSRPAGPGDAALLERFVAAFTGDDVEALVALLAEDVRLRMPPLPFEYRGRDAAARFLGSVVEHRRSIVRTVPVGVNRCPAWGEYVADPAAGRLHLVGVLVAELRDDRVAALTHFEAALGAILGLPRTLPA